MKHPGGRPTRYNPGLVSTVAAIISQDNTLRTACGTVAIHRCTLWRWSRRHPSVLAVLRRAAELREQERERSRGQLCNLERARRTHTKKGSPRPRKYREQFVGLARPTIRATARACGVHFVTAWRWTKKHRTFALACAVARFGRDIERLERLFKGR